MTGTGSGGDAQGDRLLNIENLVGSNFDDTLEGGTVSGSLDGGLGQRHRVLAHAASGAGRRRGHGQPRPDHVAEHDHGGWHQLLDFENLTGSEFNDTLIGNFGNNILTGLGGNDTLNGNAGADTMFGGTGNDLYVVDNVGDVVNETGGDGTDTVQSWISFSLADPVHAIGEIENLTLLGTARSTRRATISTTC